MNERLENFIMGLGDFYSVGNALAETVKCEHCPLKMKCGTVATETCSQTIQGYLDGMWDLDDIIEDEEGNC